MKFFRMVIAAFALSLFSISLAAQGNTTQNLDFMEGKWEIAAKIKNSPISYIEGKGTANVYVEADTLFAVMKTKFPNFEVNGVTKRVYNKQKESWDISWNPDNGGPVIYIEGQFRGDRFVELDYGKDAYDAFIGRLVIFDISKNHFSVRKDRLYDDGTLLEEVWVYEAKRID